MSHVDLCSTTNWDFFLDVATMAVPPAPVDLTGAELRLVVSLEDNTEVSQVDTSAGLTIEAGPDDTGGVQSRVLVHIPYSSHSSLVVTTEFIRAHCNLALMDSGEPKWLGRAELRIWAGPTW